MVDLSLGQQLIGQLFGEHVLKFFDDSCFFRQGRSHRYFFLIGSGTYSKYFFVSRHASQLLSRDVDGVALGFFAVFGGGGVNFDVMFLISKRQSVGSPVNIEVDME